MRLFRFANDSSIGEVFFYAFCVRYELLVFFCDLKLL